MNAKKCNHKVHPLLNCPELYCDIMALTMNNFTHLIIAGVGPDDSQLITLNPIHEAWNLRYDSRTTLKDSWGGTRGENHGSSFAFTKIYSYIIPNNTGLKSQVRNNTLTIRIDKESF